VWVHVFWLLASFVHDVDVIFLPTYKPTKIERANPQIYAANVQRVGSLRTLARIALLTHMHLVDHITQMMSEAAGVPAVQQTIESKLRHHERILAGRVSWRDDPFYCPSCSCAHFPTTTATTPNSHER
jgi:hypothetical protein